VKIEQNGQDAALFAKLKEQLERIEVSIDPYSEPALFEQWSHCIGQIMLQHERQSPAFPASNLTGECCGSTGHLGVCGRPSSPAVSLQSCAG